MSGIRCAIIVEGTHIRFLGSSKQFNTLELADKRQMNDTAKTRAEHSTVFENAGRMREKCHVPGKSKEVSRAVNLLNGLSLSSLIYLFENRSHLKIPFPKYLFST